MLDNIDATKVECVADQLKDNIATGRKDQAEEDVCTFSIFYSSPPRECQEFFICFFQ